MLVLSFRRSPGKLLTLFFGVTVVFVTGVTASLADCRVRGDRYFFNNDTQSYDVLVTGDGLCARQFRPGGRSSIESVSVVSKPSNGSLSINGVSQVIYKARTGFKGSDRFVVKVCGEGMGGKGCSTLPHDVTVQ
jgi:Bacterial Ig domain